MKQIYKYFTLLAVVLTIGVGNTWGTTAKRQVNVGRFLAVLLVLLTIGIGNAWGGNHTWSYTFAGSTDMSTSAGNKTYTGSIDGLTNKNVTWSLSAATYIGYDADKGVQIGSSGSPQKDDAWTMQTAISNIGSSIKITSIKINVAVASKGGGKYILSAGTATSGASGTAFDNTSSSDKTYNVTTDITSGNIVISLQSTKSKAMYIKSVTIGYADISGGCSTLSAPGSPSSTPGATSVDLSWSSVANSSGYLVTFDGTEYNIASGTTTKTITGLKKEKTYAWTVAAKGDGETYCAAGTATSEQSVTTLDGCSDDKVTYTVATYSSVSSSDAPSGTSASFSNTYTSNKEQITKDNSQTLTLTGYDGKKIKGLTLTMHANASSGAGTFSMAIGSTTVASISSATNFNAWYDNDSYGTDYRKVHVTLNSEVTVGTSESIVITLTGTTSSIYCQSFTLCYSSCISLGAIGGAVEFTDPTTAVLTWNDIDHVSSWSVSCEESGGSSAGSVGSITTNGAGKKTCTITGLSCDTDYDFTISPTPASGYCDKDTTLEDKNSGKWDLDYTFSGAALKDGDLDEGTGVLCGDLDITIEPLSLAYELPSDVTVTIGGDTKTKDTDYTWNSSTGELHIDGEDIDGAVAISCTATLLSCANDPSIGAVSLKTGGTFNLGQVDVTVATSGTGSATCAWTDYGFVWSESANPTVGGSGCTKVPVGSDGNATTWNGSLTKTSFATGTTYYYRAYGKNSKDDAEYVYSSSDGTFTPRSVAFNSNGGSSVSTIYVNSGGTVSAPSAPTKTGYTFDSWRTTSDLTTAMNFSGTITKDTTLYAKWTANSYTLAWSSNGGDDLTGDYTKGSTDYSTTLTPPNTPTRTGYTFAKWNTATDGSGDDYTGTMPAANTTYYAQWSINNYNTSVTANENVTITATPSGGSAIAEGGNADVEYNKTVTLNYSSLTSGLTWGGWRVYNADDASITVTVSGTGNGATFTMPAYDVVVVAYTYGDVVAWCEPQITVTGGNYLTSTKDVYVFSDTISNLLNISSSDLGSATRIEVKYLDADNSDTEVAASSSLFRVCNDGSVNYNTAEGPYDVSASRECDLTYSIKYTPTAYNTINHYKLQLILKQGTSTVLKTTEYDLYGRSLPEEFVIAVKNTNNNKWYALPNTLAGTSGAQGAITPIEIKVNNATAPTHADIAPETTVYKATGRKAATKNRRGIRFTNDDSHWLQTSSADKTYQMWLSGSSSDADQVFYLKSSDFGAYTLQMDPSQNPAKKMGIYSTNTMGYHGNPRDYAVYLLPIDTKSSPVEATVSEWSRHDALVVVDVSEIEATQVDGKLGEDESDALFTLGDAVAENTYLVRLSDDIDLSGKSGESLTLRWYDSSDELVGASTVVIPSIIGTGSEDNWSELATTPTIEDIVVVEGDIVVDEVAKAKRVIIDQLSGDGKLTINAAKALIVEETVRKLNSENFVATEVADLHIGSSSTGNGSLVMGSHDGTNKAQVDFYTKARKTAENNWVNQYIGTPFRDDEGGRGVNEDYYGSYLYSFDFDTQSWVNIKDPEEHFTPFLGYNIIRKDADAATLEMQGTLVATTNQSPTVYYKTDKAHSENVLANSWTAPIKIANFDATPSTGDFTNVEATIYIFNAGGAADAADDKTLAGQYSTYSVETAGSAVIPSMQSFSVYATAAAPSLTLNYARLVYNPAVAGIAVQPNYAPRRMKAAAVSEEMQPIRLRVSGESGYADELKIYLHEDFSDAFENGWDAHKMYGYPETPQLYAVTDDGELAILCAPDADATLLGFKAGEADTEYTFTFRYDSDEPLFLLDMQNNTYTEVQTGNAYTFQTSDVGAHNRFVLTRFAPQTPTDIEPTSDSSLKGREAATKHIIDNRIYILLRGVLYDATGRRVEGVRVTNERVNE